MHHSTYRTGVINPNCRRICDRSFGRRKRILIFVLLLALLRRPLLWWLEPTEKRRIRKFIAIQGAPKVRRRIHYDQNERFFLFLAASRDSEEDTQAITMANKKRAVTMIPANSIAQLTIIFIIPFGNNEHDRREEIGYWSRSNCVNMPLLRDGQTMLRIDLI